MSSTFEGSPLLSVRLRFVDIANVSLLQEEKARGVESGEGESERVWEELAGEEEVGVVGRSEAPSRALCIFEGVSGKTMNWVFARCGKMAGNPDMGQSGEEV